MPQASPSYARLSHRQHMAAPALAKPARRGQSRPSQRSNNYMPSPRAKPNPARAARAKGQEHTSAAHMTRTFRKRQDEQAHDKDRPNNGAAQRKPSQPN